jgi:glutamine amidotransferase PdxT
MVRVGLAMLQGARHEHAEALRAASKQLNINLEIVELRSEDGINRNAKSKPK